MWNSLPTDIQSSPSLPVFRQRLKTFLNHFLILYCDSTIRLCGLRNNSAILAALKSSIDTDTDIDMTMIMTKLVSTLVALAELEVLAIAGCRVGLRQVGDVGVHPALVGVAAVVDRVAVSCHHAQFQTVGRRLHARVARAATEPRVHHHLPTLSTRCEPATSRPTNKRTNKHGGDRIRAAGCSTINTTRSI